MSQPLVAFVAGGSSIVPQYISSLPVINPSSDHVYPPTLTNVDIVGTAGRLNNIWIKTRELSRDQNPSFETNLGNLPQERRFQFVHTCDFTLDVKVGGQTKSVFIDTTKATHQINLDVLFPAAPRRAQPDSCCTIL
jgi:hypothetical protein